MQTDNGVTYISWEVFAWIFGGGCGACVILVGIIIGFIKSGSKLAHARMDTQDARMNKHEERMEKLQEQANQISEDTKLAILTIQKNQEFERERIDTLKDMVKGSEHLASQIIEKLQFMAGYSLEQEPVQQTQKRSNRRRSDS